MTGKARYNCQIFGIMSEYDQLAFKRKKDVDLDGFRTYGRDLRDTWQECLSAIEVKPEKRKSKELIYE